MVKVAVLKLDWTDGCFHSEKTNIIWIHKAITNPFRTQCGEPQSKAMKNRVRERETVVGGERERGRGGEGLHNRIREYLL
jgi:hypothetical protein